MSTRTIVDKIWAEHVVIQQEGHPAVLAIDLMLLHEVTSAQAFRVLDGKGLKVFDSTRLLATVDHSIPTTANRHNITDEAARIQVEALRDNTKRHNIKFFDMDSGSQGIVHVIGPELGVTQPGMTIVCGDSHTATHGAFGALAFGVGTSEVGHVLTSGCMLQEKPKTMKVEFRGALPRGASAKDMVLRLIAQIGTNGGQGYAIEYTGEAVLSLSMESRMTLCNMSIECGARAGLVAPDEVTFAYLKNRTYAPQSDQWNNAVSYWMNFKSDVDAEYDACVVVDVSNLEPMITWGTNPSQAIGVSKCVPRISDLRIEERVAAQKALNYVKLKEGEVIAGTPIQWAFVGSCTNGRIEDLRMAASVIKGKRVAPSVRMIVVPGSEMVRAQAIEEGLNSVFEEAGAEFRMPGCSMCLAMNEDKVPAGERCISTSNRNFVGRQGDGSITHLASPETVAASAIKGQIASRE